MCVGSLAGITYLRYGTVLTSSNKSETAVHCYDLSLSVFVMLVSRNVFQVVSALHSVVFIHSFLADQVSCRSYVGSAYGMRSLAVILSLIYVFLDRRSFRSDTLRFKAWYWPCGLKCLGWLCQPHLFIYFYSVYFLSFSRHQLWHFGLLAPWNTSCGNACFSAQVSKSTELDIGNGSFCNLCALALWLALHIFATQCWRAPIETFFT